MSQGIGMSYFFGNRFAISEKYYTFAAQLRGRAVGSSSGS